MSLVIFTVGLFFFFKQKTAYEMRISDWSSDVCSSDLGADPRRPFFQRVDTMPKINEPRARTGYDYLAASLTSGPKAHQYRALLRAYLDHFAMPVTADARAKDRADRLATLCRPLASSASDRKTVVSATSVSVRIILGARRHLNKTI